jgi:hypothetical protein
MVGCGAFGVLRAPALAERLVETVRFTEREAVVIDLADGARRIIDYGAVAHQFVGLGAPAAAERAGMPAPVTHKVGDMHRRVDPFHSERHLSPDFRALVGVIRAGRLPCGYSLLLQRTGGWSGEFVGPHAEDPEQAAANVSETRARNPGWSMREALFDQLCRDANVAASDVEALLAACGWGEVLADLDSALRAHVDAPSYAMGALPPSAPVRVAERDVQLSLL